MSKILVLTEKPSVGRDIARVLKCTQKKNGYIEGTNYIVTWALGHLVTLASPEVYNQKYKNWTMEDLPMMPSTTKLEVIKTTRKQYTTVESQLSRKDVNLVIIATDAGREGELVARWIIEKSNSKKPIKRLWISSVTDKAIQEGFKNLKDGKSYENLYQSAVARAEADWYVGLNATRALTCKFNAQLSCGRVQTPTLFMISNRENEIRKFVPKNFYGILATSNNLKLTWQNQKSKDFRTFDKTYCDKLLTSLKNKDAKAIEVKKSKKVTQAPKLYDLTELQRDANKMFGFSAKETLSIMQNLYETHKILTYPRTDSRYLTSDIVDTLKERLKACSVGQYSNFTSKILRFPIKSSNLFVNNSKVTDHHAIIPTEQKVLLSNLSQKEFRIYDLVVKRFLSVLSPNFEYEQTTITTKIDNEVFIATGKHIIAQGWKEIYNNNYDEASSDDIEDQTLPLIKQGEILKVNNLKQTNGSTKPPSRFNEATLLSAMETPTKYFNFEDKGLAKTIGETGGIGTVATRADIIEKLFNSFLIEKRGQDIYITSKGKQLLELVPENLKSPTLTAEWEQKLNNISKGVITKNSFISEIKKYTIEVVDEIKYSDKTFKHDNKTKESCPECGKFLLQVKHKKGNILVCEDRECKYRKTLSITSNARCPNCHKKLDLVGSDDNQLFVCKCGHKEKLSAFKKRRESQGSSVSKKEASKYLQTLNSKNDTSINSAFADALNKLKS